MQMTIEVRPSMRVLGIVLGIAMAAANLIPPRADLLGILGPFLGLALAWNCWTLIKRDRQAPPEQITA